MRGSGKEGDSKNPVANEEQSTEQSHIFSEEPSLLGVAGFRFLVNETEAEETKKCRPNPPPENDQEGRLCPEAFDGRQTLAVCVGATGRVVAVFLDGSKGLSLRGRVILLLEPDTVYNDFVHLVVWVSRRKFAHTMRSIHRATIRNRGRRRCGPVPEPPREIVPIHPEPTLSELGLFANPTVDAILLGDYRRWKPLIVGGRFQLRAVALVGGSGDNVCAVDSWPKRGEGVGDGLVGTLAEGGVGH